MAGERRRRGQPVDGSDVTDVLTGVDAVTRTGLADPDRMVLLGHSYGAYLVNRIITGRHPFQAAVCWEGLADLRALDEPSLAVQTRYLGYPDEGHLLTHPDNIQHFLDYVTAWVNHHARPHPQR